MLSEIYGYAHLSKGHLASELAAFESVIPVKPQVFTPQFAPSTALQPGVRDVNVIPSGNIPHPPNMGLSDDEKKRMAQGPLGLAISRHAMNFGGMVFFGSPPEASRSPQPRHTTISAVMG